MVKIAIYSRKGGTTKTTSTFNIAGVLAKKYKKKVLVVDTDSQANLTERFLKARIDEFGNAEWLKSETTLENLFLAPEKVNEAIFNAEIRLREGVAPKKRGIDIIPIKPSEIGPSPTMENIEESIGKALPEGQIKKALDSIKHTRKHPYDYDYVIFDFSPTYNKITREILSAVDYILVPCTLDVNSLDGASQILDAINEIKGTRNPDLKLMGFFLAMNNKNTAYDVQMEAMIREALGDKCMDTVIRYNTEAKWSLHNGIPLVWNKRSGKLTADYEELVEEIIRKTGE
ncbi:MAG: ParA family protein [Lachnospiraceae bacterium]|nr:ParA family protein [Lachnospiraceae bacterium]